jgi:molecular chaperone HscC
MIRSYLAKLSGQFPSSSINPEEAVCIGAGLAAAMKDRNENLTENILTDVCPYSLGSSVSKPDFYGGYTEGHFVPIIERNTVIPCSRSHVFTTLFDNQASIAIKVYQGENRLVSGNIYLGEVEVPVPPAPQGTPRVEVRYTYDINGLLEVEVTSLDTGHTARKVIVNQDVDLSGEEIEERLKKLSSLKLHPREQERNRHLMAWGERLYQETLGHMRTVISDCLAAFSATLERQNPDEIAEAAEKLTEFLKDLDGK